MKQTLLIITALMLVVGCGSSEKEPEKKPEKEPINYETLVEKDGVFYTKDTNKPYSGKVFGLYEVGGQKISEGTLKDGKANGKLTIWHENGQKKKEGIYKDGKLDGKWTDWHDNGQKYKEGIYKDGLKDRKWTYWDENGQKWHEVTHKDGEVIEEIYWDEDGNER